MYKIFLDLDGVMANFDERVMKLTGRHPRELGQAMIWAAILYYDYANDTEFFTNLDKMPDADELWAYLKPHKPTVLSAKGAKILSADREKRDWFAEKFCPNTEVIIVDRSFHKGKYAAPNHILIDDRLKSINPWVDAGGIGILHKNTKDTILELQKLGFK